MPFRDFLFLSGAWGMVPVAVAGLWFVYSGRVQSFVPQCRFMRGGGTWAVCGAVRRSFPSSIGLAGYSHSRMPGRAVLFLSGHRAGL